MLGRTTRRVGHRAASPGSCISTFRGVYLATDRLRFALQHLPLGVDHLHVWVQIENKVCTNEPPRSYNGGKRVIRIGAGG